VILVGEQRDVSPHELLLIMTWSSPLLSKTAVPVIEMMQHSIDAPQSQCFE
jgi:hypothetical protein